MVFRNGEPDLRGPLCVCFPMVAKRANLSLFVQFNNQIGAQPTANLGEELHSEESYCARRWRFSRETNGEERHCARRWWSSRETKGEESHYARRWWSGGRAAHRGSGSSCTRPEIEFDVWSLSCIGAWVGIVYNQFDEAQQSQSMTHQFFKNHVFRDDESYERFPINSVFGPDWFGNTQALMSICI